MPRLRWLRVRRLNLRLAAWLRVGELNVRLAAAFVGVALAAVIAAIIMSSVMVSTDIDRLLSGQESQLARATVITAQQAYRHHTWRATGLEAIRDLVASEGSAARLTSPAGRVIYTTPGYARYGPQEQISFTIMAGHGNGDIGRMTIRFGPDSVVADVKRFQSESWRARTSAAAIALLLALAVSLVMTRLITSPLKALLSVVRARGAGARSIRVGNIRAVGVLRELVESFNAASDRLDRLERLRRNLVADVAHELRTPIAVLAASHEAMIDRVMEPTRENLGSMHDKVLQLAQMVEDLQRLSAAESAAMQLKPEPQDLAAVAAAAAASVVDGFEAGGIVLERRLVPVQVICDQDRMREVITNLLTNALKFTPAGGYVCLEVWPEGRDRAMLRVSDTGIGIPAHELPRVTERFFRGEHSASMATGSGIGLTIVSELVRAHDGELVITSDLDSGTQVTVTLPQLHAGRSLLRGRSRVIMARQPDLLYLLLLVN